MCLNVTLCRSLKCRGLYSDSNELLQILLHRISGVLYPIKRYSYDFVLIFFIELYLYSPQSFINYVCKYSYFLVQYSIYISKLKLRYSLQKIASRSSFLHRSPKQRSISLKSVAGLVYSHQFDVINIIDAHTRQGTHLLTGQRSPTVNSILFRQLPGTCLFQSVPPAIKKIILKSLQLLSRVTVRNLSFARFSSRQWICVRSETGDSENSLL